VAKTQEYFNIKAFAYPAAGVYGNVTRNALVGPAFIRTDLSLQRFFSLDRYRSGMRFVFRAEAFSAFNTPNLANPNAVVGGSLDGQIQSTTGSNTVMGPVGRRLQLSGTIYF
jgi:hypothetical protein